MCRNDAVFVALLWVGACVSVQAQDAPRRDLYGDELPADARARIGTVRRQHGRQVEHVAFINDGRELVSLGSDRAVSVWDVATGRERLRIAGGEANPRRMAVSASAQLVALSYGKHGIQVWRLTDGRSMPAPQTGEVDAERLAFTADGRILACTAASWGNHVALYNVETGDEVKRLPVVRDPIFSLVFSPDGKTLATGRETSSIRIWDVASGQIRHEIKEQHGWAFNLKFDPRGEILASTDSHEAVHLWSVATGRKLRTLSGHSGAVLNLAFTSDGTQLVSNADDGTVRVWDVASGKQLRRIDVNAPSIHTNVFALAPDDRTLAVTATLRLFDLKTGAELAPRPPGGGPLAWTRAGDALLTGDSALVACDPATGREVRRFEPPDRRDLRYCGFADDDRTVVGLTTGGRLLRWRRDSGELLEDRECENCVSLAFSPGGQLIAHGHSQDFVTVCETSSGQILLRCDVPLLQGARRSSHGVSQLAWSGDGRQLLVATCQGAKLSPGALRIWDVASGRIVRELQIGDGVLAKPITAMAFSPDGQIVAARTGDEQLRVWEVMSGQEIYRATLSGQVKSLAFSPDSRWLAIAADREAVVVSTLDPQRELQRFGGHRDSIQALSFAPNGRWLASSSRDGTTLVWEPGSLSIPPRPLESDEVIETLWRDLASSDAGEAGAAMRRLVAAGESVMPFLANRLQRPTARPNREQLDLWINQLADDKFSVREAASAELRKLGNASRPALEAAAAKRGVPLEIRQRLRRLIGYIEVEPFNSSERRTLRLIRLLERWNSESSRSLLTQIAAWDSGHCEAAFAQAALDRLSDRLSDRLNHAFRAENRE